MADITVNIYLYGDLASYVKQKTDYGFASQQVYLKEGSVIRDLLAHLGLPTEKRGITFINAKLSAMSGLQPDLDYVLKDNDRVAFFDLKSMWPFQYRHGAMMIEELTQALFDEKNKGLHHAYDR